MPDLASRVSLTGPPADEPEDFLSTALSLLDPDETPNIHGDAEHGVLYTSPHLPKPLTLDLADPKDDAERKLFSHYLWNSSLLLAELIEAGSLPLDAPASGSLTIGPPASAFDIRGRSAIELGAGTALPSLLAAALGASRVVVTEYPAPAIMRTLEANVARNTKVGFSPPGATATPPGDILVQGHAWGELSTPFASAHKHAFDRVLTADGLWMPWQHQNLRASISWFLKDHPDARVWVLAGFHTGRKTMSAFFDAQALLDADLEVETMWERDVAGTERQWVPVKPSEEIGGEKRWLLVAVLRRPRPGGVSAGTGLE